MTCYHPMTVWRKRGGATANGKHLITFNYNEAIPMTEMKIPCGQCIGCRLSRSREWAARIMCEMKSGGYDASNSMFLTLTYDDEHLPEDRSLCYRDFQLFMKRLRRYVELRCEKLGREAPKLRFFMCGEYGEKFGRPHYHAIVLGWKFEDWDPFCLTHGNKVLWRSMDLEELWPHGLSSGGDVTFESAAYVARYVTKKITGKRADEHYQGRTPEFCHMSTKPGIGRDFCEEFMNDLYNEDTLRLSEKIVMNPPRYFDKILEQYDPERFEKIKREREAEGREVEARGETTPARLAVREKCQQLRAKKLVRPLEAL